MVVGLNEPEDSRLSSSGYASGRDLSDYRPTAITNLAL